MKQPHKHRDVIIAWANGEEVQSRVIGTKTWDDICHPKWLDSQEYRIRPKIVEREGWVNVYKYGGGYSVAGVHATEEDALRSSGDSHITCIRIEWEEEE